MDSVQEPHDANPDANVDGTTMPLSIDTSRTTRFGRSTLEALQEDALEEIDVYLRILTRALLMTARQADSCISPLTICLQETIARYRTIRDTLAVTEWPDPQ
jgi:hypothetical protein